MSKTTLWQFIKNLAHWAPNQAEPKAEPEKSPSEECIGPFIISETEKSVSILLNAGTYKQHIFDEESENGFCGNGHDWASLAREFIKEQLPHLQKDIQLEYLYNRKDRCRFCARSENKESILEFAQLFHNMCEDEKQMREILSRSELD